jgi:hypothetical protein
MKKLLVCRVFTFLALFAAGLTVGQWVQASRPATAVRGVVSVGGSATGMSSLVQQTPADPPLLATVAISGFTWSGTPPTMTLPTMMISCQHERQQFVCHRDAGSDWGTCSPVPQRMASGEPHAQ